MLIRAGDALRLFEMKLSGVWVSKATLYNHLPG